LFVSDSMNLVSGIQHVDASEDTDVNIKYRYHSKQLLLNHNDYLYFKNIIKDKQLNLIK
jgi:hypothetical protein